MAKATPKPHKSTKAISVSRQRVSTPDTKMSGAEDILSTLSGLGNVVQARLAQRFFRTGPGEYGEGDQFLGIRVPQLRTLVGQVARDTRDVSLEVILPLLKSSWHEARAVALMLMVKIYQRGDAAIRARLYHLYLKNTRFINNWDLVDLSAEHIVGAWLVDKDRTPLVKLAHSSSLWERRIAILATFYYIKRGEYAETLRIAELLLKDKEDLIHKAVGWMLREVGKRIGEEQEEGFLRRHYRTMPRTMLRYAIERFAEPKRKRYLLGQE